MKKQQTHKQFKVAAARFDLQDGEHIYPDTLIGEDWETGEPIEAGCTGRVQRIEFSGGDHAFTVTIAIESEDD